MGALAAAAKPIVVSTVTTVLGVSTAARLRGHGLRVAALGGCDEGGRGGDRDWPAVTKGEVDAIVACPLVMQRKVLYRRCAVLR